MAQDSNPYPETEIEEVRSLFASGPDSPVELFEFSWPPDPDAQSQIALRLIEVSQDQTLDWGIRMKAFDFLNEKARQMGRALYPNEGPPTGDYVPGLVLWCVKRVSGLAEEPKRGPGRDPNDRVMRNLRIFLAVRMLSTDYGRSQEYSIGLIAYATGQKEGTVKSGLRAMNELFKASGAGAL